MSSRIEYSRILREGTSGTDRTRAAGISTRARVCRRRRIVSAQIMETLISFHQDRVKAPSIEMLNLEA